MSPVETSIDKAAGPPRRRGGLQPQLRRWAASAGVSLRVAPVLHAVDRILLGLTRDRTCLTTLAIGIPVLLIRTTGARSGKRRARPLTVVPDGERLVLVASNFGRRHHPGWYHNLRADPRAEVRREGRWRRYSARLVEAAERDRLWGAALGIYSGFSDYARRAAPRQIPVLILEPLHPEAA